MLKAHMRLSVTEPDIPEKIILPQKIVKWTKNGQKHGF